MSVHSLPHRERDCYACFDMERGGKWTCPACGRPYGARLAPSERPPIPLAYWLDPSLDPRPADGEGTLAHIRKPIVKDDERPTD